MFDSLTVAALTDELSHRLLGGRIQKVLQLDPDSIGLEIYAEHQRQYLVASASSRNPRVYLASTRLSADPSVVSPLLLLMRKYARGAEIVSIQQPPLERVIRLSIAKRFFMDKKRELQEEPEDDEDEGEIIYSDLIVEIMGRRSNIILTSDEGRIHDAVKRVTPEMSRVRPILPGKHYEPPPPQDKRDPRRLTAADIAKMLRDVEPGTGLASALVANLAGFSPQMAREATFRAMGDQPFDFTEPLSSEQCERLCGAIQDMLRPLETSRWDPAVYRNAQGQVAAYAPIPMKHLAGEAAEEHIDSISRAIELAAQDSASQAPVRHAQRRAQLVSEIEEALKRAATRVHSIHEEETRAREVERWRESGELIYAYIHQIGPGDTALVVDGQSIDLDPALSASENAQEYFERYRKAQAATQHLPELAAEAQGTLDYLKQLRAMAELSDGIDQIEAVRHEWQDWRQPRDSDRNKKGSKQPRRKQPVAYRTRRGDTIYVGHSGPENEMVTFDIGGPEDIWLHARGVPGGHVILRWAGGESDDVLEAAASLAAWFSSGRTSTTVEVDATERRYVRKIKGAGPGMVTYRNEQTLNVKPRSPEDLDFN